MLHWILTLILVAAVAKMYKDVRALRKQVDVYTAPPLDTSNIMDPRDAASHAVDNHVSEFHGGSR